MAIVLSVPCCNACMLQNYLYHVAMHVCYNVTLPLPTPRYTIVRIYIQHSPTSTATSSYHWGKTACIYIPLHRTCHVTHTGVRVLISYWTGKDQPEVGGGEEGRRTVVRQLENSCAEGQGTLCMRNLIIIGTLLIPAQHMHACTSALCLVTLSFSCTQ